MMMLTEYKAAIPGIKAIKALATAGGTVSGSLMDISFFIRKIKTTLAIPPKIIAVKRLVEPKLPVANAFGTTTTVPLMLAPASVNNLATLAERPFPKVIELPELMPMKKAANDTNEPDTPSRW